MERDEYMSVVKKKKKRNGNGKMDPYRTRLRGGKHGIHNHIGRRTTANEEMYPGYKFQSGGVPTGVGRCIRR